MAQRPLRAFWRGGVGATSSGPLVTSPPASQTAPQHPEEDEPFDLPDPNDPEPPHVPDPWAAAASMAMPPPRLPTSPVRSPVGRAATPKAAAASPKADKKYVDYKIDPAPVWGGDDPERNYKELQRNLQLWLVEAEARLPPGLIGKRIIDSIPLGSRLSALLAHLTVDKITSDTGHKQIVSIIESAHEYLKDHRLEQAFEDAIFKGRRDRGMSLTMFLTNKNAAFAELRKQGLDLLATAAGRHLLGHLILRQGGFSQDQKQRLKVVTNGSIDFRDLESAIQKVFGDKLDEQAGP